MAQAVSEATGIPWVYEVRGLAEQTWIASKPSGKAQREAAAAEKPRLVAMREAQLACEADAVVTLSSTMAEVLASRGVPHGHITLVPNGVDASFFEDHVSPQQARCALAPRMPDEWQSAVLVGAASALVDYEGYDILLRAVASLVRNANAPARLREKLRVVLVGDGSSLPRLQWLARELGIEDRVLLPGRVPSAEARTWIQALDAVVVPRRDWSVTRLVTPQKPVEAMALGRPVIVSDLPALREVVEKDGKLAGMIFTADRPAELANSIATLLSEERTYQDLVRRGHELARTRT